MSPMFTWGVRLNWGHSPSAPHLSTSCPPEFRHKGIVGISHPVRFRSQPCRVEGQALLHLRGLGGNTDAFILRSASATPTDEVRKLFVSDHSSKCIGESCPTPRPCPPTHDRLHRERSHYRNRCTHYKRNNPICIHSWLPRCLLQAGCSVWGFGSKPRWPAVLGSILTVEGFSKEVSSRMAEECDETVGVCPPLVGGIQGIPHTEPDPSCPRDVVAMRRLRRTIHPYPWFVADERHEGGDPAWVKPAQPH